MFRSEADLIQICCWKPLKKQGNMRKFFTSVETPQAANQMLTKNSNPTETRLANAHTRPKTTPNSTGILAATTIDFKKTKKSINAKPTCLKWSTNVVAEIFGAKTINREPFFTTKCMLVRVQEFSAIRSTNRVCRFVSPTIHGSSMDATLDTVGGRHRLLHTASLRVGICPARQDFFIMVFNCS